MHSYVFTSRYFRQVFLLALIATVTSILSPMRQATAGQDHFIYLPSIIRDRSGGTQPPPPTGSPEQQALDRLNYYRSLAGSSLLQLHLALVMSAQNHANYYLRNIDDSSAWPYGYHTEAVGKPGYTGQWPGDRAVAAGYPWTAGWEAMSFDDDPSLGVDQLIATVFHRVGMLDPYMEYMGYGHGRSTMARVDVMDFGHGTTDTNRKQVVVFPAPGQTNVPLYGAGESPSPVPPGTLFMGYPITIQPINSVPLTVTLAELRDSNGALVSVHPNPSNCGTSCYALIPVNPLQKTTTYTVHVVGTLDGDPFDKSWTFTTMS